MKNIRIFVVSSSLILATWLGASYLTELSPFPYQNNRATSLEKETDTIDSKQLVADEVEKEEAMPVAQLD